MFAAPMPAPTPPPSSESDAATTLLAVLLCWAGPAIAYTLSVTNNKQPISPTRKTAVAATGVEVPKDIERRKAAMKEQPAQRVGLQRALLFLAFLVPHILVHFFQSGPTMTEQLKEWWADQQQPSVAALSRDLATSCTQLRRHFARVGFEPHSRPTDEEVVQAYRQLHERQHKTALVSKPTQLTDGKQLSVPGNAVIVPLLRPPAGQVCVVAQPKPLRHLRRRGGVVVCEYRVGEVVLGDHGHGPCGLCGQILGDGLDLTHVCLDLHHHHGRGGRRRDLSHRDHARV